MKFPGKRPATLGVRDGKLAACPDKPNCVSSQATSRKHSIAPLAASGDQTTTMQRVKSAVEAAPRTRIIESRPDYLYAEFETAGLGFVDDVEFFWDGRQVQVRSASRLGYSDWGVNRKRVEALRKLIEA